MFTGIIEAVGSIAKMEDCNGDRRYSILAGKLDLSDLSVGHSIAVNGVCLSIVELHNDRFVADVSIETLSCTTFDTLVEGSRVNLEKSLQFSDRLNGHLVSGHVDGVGMIRKRTTDARSERFVIETTEKLLKYICNKGSVCIDGVSLTVNETDASSFMVNIIPHTLQETTFRDFREGTKVNIEVDIIARYLESLCNSLS